MGGQKYNWIYGAKFEYVNTISPNNFIAKTTIILFQIKTKTMKLFKHRYLRKSC